MRHLIVCCDGTWNTPGQQQAGRPTPTNVVRLRNIIKETGTQLIYYHTGVGVSSDLLGHLAGGAVGVGLSRNVQSAYNWLATTYRDGDRIYLFGFSRGAYTVRSLGGMLGTCGLVSLPEGEVDDTDRWARIEQIYDVYRSKGDPVGPIPEITFLGVWDTVGALGIPASLGTLRVAADLLRLIPHFHDLSLGEHVVHARHAVALDERRAPFGPTLWDNLPITDPGRSAAQVWFPGDHCDIGGGHPETGLSNRTLTWMLEELCHVCPDLDVNRKLLTQVVCDPRDVIHDDAVGLYGLLGPVPRAAPFLAKDAPSEEQAKADRNNGIDGIDESAYHRRGEFPIATGPYRDARLVHIGDPPRSVPVWAREPWNWTGLYLEPGSYTLTATGQWLDGRTAYGPDGVPAHHGHPHPLHALGDAAGHAQHLMRALTHDETLTSLGALRLPGEPWMALVAAVAVPDLDPRQGQRPYQQICVGNRCALTVPKPGGYLYAYANDAWGAYDHNRGSVTLTVERVP